jgi:hypothetical protein
VISAEKLEEMRRLCDEDEPYKKPAISEAEKNNEY